MKGQPSEKIVWAEQIQRILESGKKTSVRLRTPSVVAVLKNRYKYRLIQVSI